MALPSFSVHGGLPSQRSRSHARAPRAGVIRKDFTDRLGLPADATNAQVFAAIDAVKQAKHSATPSTATLSAEDALYALAFGAAEQPTSSAALDAADALYKAVWG